MKHLANEAGGEQVNRAEGEKMGTESPGWHRGRHQKEGWGEWRVRNRDRRGEMTVGDGEGEKNNVISVKQTKQGGMERMKEQMKKQTQRRMETGFFFCDWPPNNRFFILRGILLLTISPSLQTVWHHCHALWCQLGLGLPMERLRTRIFRFFLFYFFRKIVFLKDTNRCRDVSFDLSTNKWPHQTKDKLEKTQQNCSIPGKCWPELKTYTHTQKIASPSVLTHVKSCSWHWLTWAMTIGLGQ